MEKHLSKFLVSKLNDTSVIENAERMVKKNNKLRGDIDFWLSLSLMIPNFFVEWELYELVNYVLSLIDFFI